MNAVEQVVSTILSPIQSSVTNENNTINHTALNTLQSSRSQNVLNNSLFNSNNRIKKSQSSANISLSPTLMSYNSNINKYNDTQNEPNSSKMRSQGANNVNNLLKNLSLSTKSSTRRLNDSHNQQQVNGGVNGIGTANNTQHHAHNYSHSSHQQQSPHHHHNTTSTTHHPTHHYTDTHSETSTNIVDSHNMIDDDNSRVLFVGDLARIVNEDELYDLFMRCGSVTLVDIKRDKITGNNLGYGFIHFNSRNDAKQAKHDLQNYELHGRRIRIGWAQKNTTLFIGDLDGKVTSEQLRDTFSQFGSIIEEGTFVKDGSRKYGFVEFKHRSDAELAKQHMNKQVVGTRPIRIGWGDNALQKCCVHIQYDGIVGAHLVENDFRPLFEPYGTIQAIVIPRNLNTKSSQNNNKMYCFIHYTDTDEGEDAATNAIHQLQNTKLQGVTLHLSYGKRQIYSKRKQDREHKSNIHHNVHHNNSTTGQHHNSHNNVLLHSYNQNNAHNNNYYSSSTASNNTNSRQPLLNINHVEYLQPSHISQYNNPTYNVHTSPLFSSISQNTGYDYTNGITPSTTATHQQQHHHHITAPSTTTHNTGNTHFSFNPASSPGFNSSIPSVYTAADQIQHIQRSPMLNTITPHITSSQPQYFLPQLDQTPALSSQPAPSYNQYISSPHTANGLSTVQLSRQASDTLSILSQFNTPLFTPGYMPTQLYWQQSQPTLMPLPSAMNIQDNNKIHSISQQQSNKYHQRQSVSSTQNNAATATSILHELRANANKTNTQAQ